jgi:hypothetical protein
MIIRKLIVGTNPKDGMAYMVGTNAGKTGVVSEIVYDDETFDTYGIKRYLVYIQENNATVLWKIVENCPCIVELDCDFDK